MVLRLPTFGNGPTIIFVSPIRWIVRGTLDPPNLISPIIFYTTGNFLQAQVSIDTCVSLW